MGRAATVQYKGQSSWLVMVGSSNVSAVGDVNFMFAGRSNLVCADGLFECQRTERPTAPSQNPDVPVRPGETGPDEEPAGTPTTNTSNMQPNASSNDTVPGANVPQHAAPEDTNQPMSPPGGPPGNPFGPDQAGNPFGGPMHSTLDPVDSTVQVCNICEEWPEAAFNWKLCDPTGKARIPSRNNLGGLGPSEDDPQEIRYDNVATFRNVDMDLVVTNKTVYTPYNISRNVVSDEIHDVGVYGCFGVVNVAHDTDVRLNFAFKLHGTDYFMEFDSNDKFVFSVWDLDNSLKWGNEERVAFDTKYLDSTRAHDLIDNSSLFEVRSMAIGTGNDNPVTDTNWVNKSIEAQYKGSSTWDVEFSVTGGSRGRNFLFHGCRPCS